MRQKPQTPVILKTGELVYLLYYHGDLSIVHFDDGQQEAISSDLIENLDIVEHLRRIG